MISFCAQIAVSLNLLFYGYQPLKPLAEHIREGGNTPICGSFVPELSQKPIAVCDGNIVQAMLAEIKGDWKFFKDRYSLPNVL